MAANQIGNGWISSVTLSFNSPLAVSTSPPSTASVRVGRRVELFSGENANVLSLQRIGMSNGFVAAQDATCQLGARFAVTPNHHNSRSRLPLLNHQAIVEACKGPTRQMGLSRTWAACKNNGSCP